MKRALLVLGILVVVVVGLVVVLVRNDRRTPDFMFLKGNDPFSTEILLGKGKYLPRAKLRRYSVHMDYDAAVIAARNELKGWKGIPVYDDCMFKSPDGEEYVLIRRSRTDLDFKVTPHHPIVASAVRRDVLAAVVHQPVPDPSGWVTVTTMRKINGVVGLVDRLMRYGKHVHSRDYVEISREGKPPHGGFPSSVPVNVDAGTSSLETDTITIRYYSITDY